MTVAKVCRRFIGLALWLSLAAPVSAATVTLAWDPSPETNVTNYNVFVRTQFGSFGAGVPVGNRTNWTFVGLQNGTQYYFAVQAQSSTGLSPLSQIGYVTPLPNLAGSEPSRSDFNMDGRFDLLWHHQVTGQLTAWHMNGPTILYSRYLTPNAAPLTWKLRGSGDFNADGKADLVWQNVTTGEVVCWLMDGALQYSAAWITPSVHPSWEIASVRDMNRDGFPDLLWTNGSTGQVVVWYMNRTTRVSQAWINATPLTDPNWKLRGSADFTGDGKPDLLWQHEVSGEPVLWIMNGATQVAGAPLPAPGAGVWKIRSVGDTNQDGWPDFLFHNSSTGHVVIWTMRGRTFFSNQWVGVVDPNWRMSAPR